MMLDFLVLAIFTGVIVLVYRFALEGADVSVAALGREEQHIRA